MLRIEGAVSGTLMYVVSAVSAGRPFSEAVREAVETGYAEPDPRDDLNGRDAARKVLILARLMGYRGAAPTPENLVPPALAKLPLADFMKAAAERGRRLGGAGQARKPRADACCATSSRRRRRSVSAKLVAVPVDSPIGALQGTRNLVAFTTRRYRTEPLVVSGPGAGAAVTAAGILNDIYSLHALTARPGTASADQTARRRIDTMLRAAS